MTFKREDPRPQLNVRVDQAWMDELDAYAEETGKSKSEIVREAVTAVLPSGESTDAELPDNEGLRKAYIWLRDNVGPDGRIHGKHAMSGLAQHLGMQKKIVRNSRVVHLKREGWITTRNGHICVLRRTRPAEEA